MVGGAGALVALALAWLWLAPTGLGGSASYAIVTGTSMEPSLHGGDLVILRQAEPRVGDVAGYRDPHLGRVVLHRIVGGGPDGFVLQGDNNDYLDPARPPASAILGVQRMRIPGAGHVLQRVRQPTTAALLASGIIVFPLGGGIGVRRRRRRRQRHDDAGVGPTPRPRSPSPGLGAGWNPTGLVAVGTATVLFASLCAVAFTRDPTATTRVDQALQHVGSLTYAASATPGPVYPSGRLVTGEAAFVRLVDAIDFRFTYRLESSLRHDVRATAQLFAEVSDGAGWSRRLPLGPREQAPGGEARAGGRLDLGDVRALTRSVAAQTGSTTDSYRVTVVPQVELYGTLAGAPLRSSFAPGLAFQLDDVRLRLEEVAGADGEPANSTERSASESAVVATPARLTALGHGVQVDHARKAGVLGLEVSLALLFLLGAPVLRAARRDEPSRIRLRYGTRLLPVLPNAERAARPFVPVTNIGGLVRLAERADRMILVEERADRHRYTVDDDGVAYRYEAMSAAS